MKQLGGHSFFYRGEADDAIGLEQVVEPWLEGLPEALTKVKNEIKAIPTSQMEEYLRDITLREEVKD